MPIISPWVCPPDSDSYRKMIKHYQHISLPYTQLSLLNDINTPSAHGLENSKDDNKYQVNSVTEVYPSRQDK